ncbi:unnamed protein product, partial [Porites lobata]
EANRQLADHTFYEKIPSDATQSFQQEVTSFIETAIGNNQLRPSATNLIVERPRTSKFYLLPKIHNPGNPGRPIVFARSCPTELLFLYLDHVTAPFVRSLDSYVKDTTHMLNILDSFRFRDRYMDDVAGAASCSEEDLRQFLEFASSFHPNLEYTWSVSTDKLPFLDICMKPQANRITTSIHYKATDSHSYLNFSSSHSYSCKSSIPYSQFLRLREICSDDADFDIEAAKMETSFTARGYPNDLIRKGRERASTKSRA